jgi:AraC-like DNA-binding protein
MDPLSDILAMLTVERAASLRFESSGPYAMRFGGYEHIKFGAVLSGCVRLWVDGDPEPLDLGPGDCYLLTDGRPYRTANADGVPEIDGNAFFAQGLDQHGVVRLGPEPPDKVVIGGRFAFDREGAAWLRGALPSKIHIPASSPVAGPLSATLALLRAEPNGGALGQTIIIDRLADILLVQSIRAHLESAGPDAGSWLSALADPRIGTALRRFHNDVAADWTVADLAEIAGMSRSSFAERFRERVGMTPIDYLTRWRMFRVRRLLIDTNLPFTTIAARNGYNSRTSCSQAFKRMFGQSPNDIRTHCVTRSKPETVATAQSLPTIRPQVSAELS